MANLIFQGTEKAVNFGQLSNEITNRKTRSAWEHGVTLYALDLLQTLREASDYHARNGEPTKADEKTLLNGANSWSDYAWGGSGLCYNYAIAERLCSPSELKKTKDGELRPNRREEWLDVEARALYQAAGILLKAIGSHKAKENATE